MVLLKVKKFKYDGLISNLIVLFIFLSLSPSFAQNNSTYIVQPPQNVPQIKLLTERDHVQIAELIRFTLEPESLTTFSEFNFRFGDGIEEIKKQLTRVNLIRFENQVKSLGKTSFRII